MISTQISLILPASTPIYTSFAHLHPPPQTTCVSALVIRSKLLAMVSNKDGPTFGPIIKMIKISLWQGIFNLVQKDGMAGVREASFYKNCSFFYKILKRPLTLQKLSPKIVKIVSKNSTKFQKIKKCQNGLCVSK